MAPDKRGWRSISGRFGQGRSHDLTNSPERDQFVSRCAPASTRSSATAPWWTGVAPQVHGEPPHSWFVASPYGGGLSLQPLDLLGSDSINVPASRLHERRVDRYREQRGQCWRRRRVCRLDPVASAAGLWRQLRSGTDELTRWVMTAMKGP